MAVEAPSGSDHHYSAPLVVWATVFGLVVLIPWAIVKTMSGAAEIVEIRAYRQSLTVQEPVTQPRIEDDSLLVEAEA